MGGEKRKGGRDMNEGEGNGENAAQEDGNVEEGGMDMGLTYGSAGVDIKEEERSIASLVSQFSKKTGLEGHFTGLIEFGDGYLSMCTDGVGSKVEVANALRKWDTVGIDCMAMNVNDLICIGAKPIAFVDYLALEKHDVEFARQIGAGLNKGAEMGQVSIVGGETATLPGIVKGFDLAGACTGYVDKDHLVTGENVAPGDVLIGLASSGIHSNGYTLVRRILEIGGVGYTDPFHSGEGSAWGDVLLTPTKIYVKPVLAVLNKYRVHGMAHITGGGLLNIPRMNKNVGYEITKPLSVPPVFLELQEMGGVEDREMFQTFNMGMGYVMAVAGEDVEGIIGILQEHGEEAKIVGRVVEGRGIKHVPLGLEYVG